MSRKKGPRPHRTPEEPQEPEQWGFTGLTQIKGTSPEVAYGEIVNNLVDDPAALAIFDTLASSPDGQQLLADFAEQWAEQGFTPPWERAREILSERGKGNE